MRERYLSLTPEIAVTRLRYNTSPDYIECALLHSGAPSIFLMCSAIISMIEDEDADLARLLRIRYLPIAVILDDATPQHFIAFMEVFKCELPSHFRWWLNRFCQRINPSFVPKRYRGDLR